MTESKSNLARYAVTSPFLASKQFAWFVNYEDAQDFITALTVKPTYYAIEALED